ncbi:MAG: DUF58 domain-containing protein [Deltaproteobacteria bacterium]|nr:DUF58 domain-containing protein [Deltaproteobacteria bacterium]
MTLRARYVVEGTLWGLHRSPHHGQSVEFAEHKNYAPGDDLRHIDWKAYGKFDKYYVKKYEEETELWGYLLLDCSGSMGYARPGAVTKLTYAACLAAAIAYLLLRQQDRVGVMRFAAAERLYLPPRSRAGHLADVMQALDEARARGATDVAGVLTQVSEVARRRSLVVLLSDLFDQSPQVPGLLRKLRARGHEVVVFHVLDPDETEFPFEDLTLFESLEGPDRILCDPRGVREAYLEELGRFLEATRDACVGADIEYHRVSTVTALDDALIEFMRAHEHRVRSARR